MNHSSAFHILSAYKQFVELVLMRCMLCRHLWIENSLSDRACFMRLCIQKMNKISTHSKSSICSYHEYVNGWMDVTAHSSPTTYPIFSFSLVRTGNTL